GFTVATLPQIFTTYLTGDYDFRVFGGWATRITIGIIANTLKKVLGEPLTQDKLKGLKLGPFTTRYHWNQYDNQINSEFINMYSNAYGTVPDLFTSGTFTAASSIVQAVNKSHSTKGADIANALHGMTVKHTPKGEGGYVFQEYNNQARSAMTVANPAITSEQWIDLWKPKIMPGEPVARIPKDEVTIPKGSSAMGCSL
ncbi:MAG: ABC transporter substrate-binding protein, partial [Halobacteriaceae archaeon]